MTGGGWIDVTAGSCKLTTAARSDRQGELRVRREVQEGRTPDGQTEFQFQAGNLNFHSEAYSGSSCPAHKAQYRGTGEINGVTGYKLHPDRL